MKRTMVAVVAVVALVLMAFAPGSLAAGNKGSTASAYHENSAVLAAVAKPKTGGLPYTGFDVALVVVGGIALAGCGFAVRRFGRRSA